MIRWAGLLHEQVRTAPPLTSSLLLLLDSLVSPPGLALLSKLERGAGPRIFLGKGIGVFVGVGREGGKCVIWWRGDFSSGSIS